MKNPRNTYRPLEKNTLNKVNNTFFQPKLTVNKPNDVYEQEADDMADKVMRMRDSTQSESAFFSPALNGIQRKCQHCEEEEKLHRKENSDAETPGSNELDNYVGSLGTSGQAFPENSRQFFEPRFGQNFSNVRIHTDSVAAKSAQSINALAYTTGNNIVFNNGQYSPESESGKKLIAHELTHVIQQNGSNNLVNKTDNPALSKSSTPLLMRLAPDGVDAAADAAWISEIRRQSAFRMSLAYTKYRAAIQTVQTEMDKKEAQPTLLEQLISLAIGALAPGIAGAFLPRIRDGLKGVASTVIGTVLKGKDETAINAYIKAEALADKYIDLDGKTAKDGYLALLENARKNATTVAPGTGKPLPAKQLLLQFSEAYSQELDRINAQIGQTEDRAALMGVYAAFDPTVATEGVYVSQIRDLVSKHEEIVKYAANETAGPFSNAFDYRRIIMLEAYNVKKPALIEYSPISIMASKKDYWKFIKWVSPEVENTAIAAGKTQEEGSNFKKQIGLQEAKAGEPYGSSFDLPIQGHIDNPISEGDRIVEIDAWARIRLCHVKVEGDGGKFISWISPDDEAFARIQGGRQPGGIIRMNADNIKDKKQP